MFKSPPQTVVLKVDERGFEFELIFYHQELLPTGSGRTLEARSCRS